MSPSGQAAVCGRPFDHPRRSRLQAAGLRRLAHGVVGQHPPSSQLTAVLDKSIIAQCLVALRHPMAMDNH